jgi:Na+/proline symporter
MCKEVSPVSAVTAHPRSILHIQHPIRRIAMSTTSPPRRRVLKRNSFVWPRYSPCYYILEMFCFAIAGLIVWQQALSSWAQPNEISKVFEPQT